MWAGIRFTMPPADPRRGHPISYLPQFCGRDKSRPYTAICFTDSLIYRFTDPLSSTGVSHHFHFGFGFPYPIKSSAQMAVLRVKEKCLTVQLIAL